MSRAARSSALQLVKRVRHPHLVPVNAFWLKSADGSVLGEDFAELPDLPGSPSSSSPLRETLMAPSVTSMPEVAELVIVMGLGDQSLFDRFEACRSEGQKGIPEDELLRYMVDAARAIDFLNSPVHESGSGPIAIQHCDIKPHNLMIVGDAIQVCDFGLARMIGADRATTAAATIAYAAPECLDPGKPSPTTDQYSLAISYYEMRNGVLPYATETLTAIMEAKKTGGLDFSASPSGEQTVLRRATSPDPADRYPSASAMVEALRQAARGELAEATPIAAPARPARFAAVALLAVLVAAGVALWKFIPWSSVERKPQAVKTPRDSGDRNTAEVKPGSSSSSSAEPAKPGSQDLGSIPRPRNESPKPPVTTPSPDDLLARAAKLLRDRKYDEAAEVLTEAVPLAPRDARIFSRRGTARFMQGRFQDAVNDFDEAIRLVPDALDYVNRGRAYRKLEKLAAAEADFTEAIRLDPGSAAAHFFRGELYQGKSLNTKAIADLGTAIQLASGKPDPGFPLAEAYEIRGLCRMLSDQIDAAVQDFTAAIEREPQDLADLYELRASARESQGKAQLAKVDNRMAAALKRMHAAPGDAAAMDDLAAACAAAGDRTQAVTWQRKAIETEKEPAAKEKYRTRLPQYESKQP